MTSKKDKHEFMPVIAVSPGDTIKENMTFLGMNKRAGCAAAHLGEASQPDHKWPCADYV